jgi:hypothetical protein
MAKRKPLKVVGRHQYQLTGPAKHFPRANLEGAGQQDGSKIDFDHHPSHIKNAADILWTRALEQAKADLQGSDPHANIPTDQLRQLARYYYQSGGKPPPAELAPDAQQAYTAQTPADRAYTASQALGGDERQVPQYGTNGPLGLTDLPGLLPLAKGNNPATRLWNKPLQLDRNHPFLIPSVAGYGQLLRDRLRGATDATGKLRENQLTGEDPLAVTQYLNEDNIASLVSQRDQAQQRGDTPTVQRLTNEIQHYQPLDPADVVRQHGLSASPSLLSDLGSTVSSIAQSKLTPAAIARNQAIGAGAGSTLAGILTGHPHTGAMAGQAAGGVADALAMRFGRGLVSKLPGAGLASGAVLRSGIHAGEDLANWATGNPAWDAARARNIQDETLAESQNGVTQGHSIPTIGALARAALLGNAAPARAQADTAWGLAHPESSSGQEVMQTQHQEQSALAANEAYHQAMEFLRHDPRFSGMPPEQMEQFAHSAAQRAGGADTAGGTAAIDENQITQGAPQAQQFTGTGKSRRLVPQPTGQLTPQQVQSNQPASYSTAGIAQFAGAKARYDQGSPTPEDVQLLKGYAGVPDQKENLTPDQLNMASRNASAYHRFGPQVAQQLVGQNVNPVGNTTAPSAFGQPIQIAAPETAGAAAPPTATPVSAPLSRSRTPAPGPAATPGFAPPTRGLAVEAALAGRVPQAPGTQPTHQPAAQPAAPVPAWQSSADTFAQDPRANYQQYLDSFKNLPEDQRRQSLRYWFGQMQKLHPEIVEEQAKKQYGNLVGSAAPAINNIQNWISGHTGLNVGGTNTWSDEAIAKMVQDNAHQQAVAAGQGFNKQLDAQWGDKQKGGWGNYLMSNPSLAMMPLGLAGLASGNRMGQILGLMAMAGGAYNLYNRWQALKDPKFQQAMQVWQGDKAAQNAGTATPAQLARIATTEKQYGTQIQDLSVAHHAFGVDPAQAAVQKADEQFSILTPHTGMPTAAPPSTTQQSNTPSVQPVPVQPAGPVAAQTPKPPVANVAKPSSSIQTQPARPASTPAVAQNVPNQFHPANVLNRFTPPAMPGKVPA